jgi:hypothetical protein
MGKWQSSGSSGDKFLVDLIMIGTGIWLFKKVFKKKKSKGSPGIDK